MKIKDYLHFYIGCECQMMGQENPKETFKLTGISYDDTQNLWWAYFAATEEMYAIIDDVFPVLRRLSDMTEEDARMIYKFGASHAITNPKHALLLFTKSPFKPIHGINSCGLMMELLSKGFDLFGLIDAGLAIDNKSL